jgi:MFS transporter, DHA1 family, tetracycline resistance protein
MQKIIQSPLTTIVLTIFLDALGFAILIPIVPLLLADPDSTFYILPPQVPIQTGYILLGLLLATFPAMQFFSSSILGQLSDKFGRKKVLMYTIAGTSFSYLLFGLGIYFKLIPILFIARALAGIAAGNLSVAQASIADVTRPQDRAKNFGLIGAAFGIGFILGPFIGGKLSDPAIFSWFSPSTPFYFAAILSFINIFSVKYFLQETNKHFIARPKIIWMRSIKNILKVFELKDLRLLYLTTFLFFSGFTFFVTFMSVFLISRYGLNQGQIGDYFSYIGIWVAITQAIITRFIAGFFSERQVLRFSLIGAGIAVALIFFTNNYWQLFFVSPLFAICNGLSFANLAGLISRSADQKVQGEILGINASVQALGQLIPPIISGVIAASLTPEAPLIIASIIIVSSGFIFLTLYHPQSTGTNAS